MIKLNTEVCREMFTDKELEMNIGDASTRFKLIKEHPTFLVYEPFVLPRLNVINNTVIRGTPVGRSIRLIEMDLLMFNLI